MRGYEGFSPKNFRRMQEHVAPVPRKVSRRMVKAELKGKI